MRRGTRAATAALFTVLATVLATALGTLAGPVGGTDRAAAAPEQARVLRVAPLYHRTTFADPSVASYAGGLVAVATGPYARRAVARTAGGPWHRTHRVLKRMPRWARSTSVWAPDLVRGRHGWLLYYAAVATKPHRRCIGVAVARHPLDGFRPVGRRPLACPRQGAIDPSAFVGRHGRRYLLFRTQGVPATIRVLHLSRDGRHRARHTLARTVLRSRHIVENPVAVRHGRELVLFTSEFYWGSCSYRTTWRRAHHVLGWRHAATHSLLDRHRTRVCGPGGADVTGRRKHQVMFFHGWRCGRGWRPCVERRNAKRVLYAAHLRWRHGTPRVQGYVRRR